ncbi:sugar kinase (plasmid) [Deinococcus aetherius]|uniref:Sugar kinase n=1 Tax=Deinococcus aetherius TaxID=200252 RepID=A0ABN6RNM8_9DEIO|nr:FGGY family carbohydrate kinase [Deinococcus aetherius]BDP44448.1 sugar kinase [Deinococcus aetherius]
MYLGLDLGTGSVKVALFGEGGEPVREASGAYAVQAPRPSWAESDPEEWWAAVGRVTREVVGEDGPRVRALGLSGQMHGVVLCGADGVPLRPAVLWADGRASSVLGAYRALPGELRLTLRNPVTAGMAGPGLLWLRGHEADLYARARWALQPKDWLRLRLTGEAHAEPSDASGTLLYDPERDGWNFPLVEALGLRADLLAPLVPSGAVAGVLTPGAASHLGLPPGLPVAAGAADTAAALLGTGLPAGQVQLTVGTGAQLVLREEGVPGARPGLHVFRTAAQRGGYLLGAVQNAGLALEWARRALRCEWEEFYALAREAEPGSRGLLFLPYLTGDRTPHLDPHARGGWLGAGLEHGPHHLARAAFEGVALSIREALLLLPETARPALRLAGGGSVHPWWRQLLADVLGRPLEGVEVPGASALGAALLARAAVTGRAPEVEGPRIQETVEPHSDHDWAEVAGRFAAAYGALRDWFPAGGQDGR